MSGYFDLDKESPLESLEKCPAEFWSRSETRDGGGAAGFSSSSSSLRPGSTLAEDYLLRGTGIDCGVGVDVGADAGRIDILAPRPGAYAWQCKRNGWCPSSKPYLSSSPSPSPCSCSNESHGNLHKAMPPFDTVDVAVAGTGIIVIIVFIVVRK